MTRARTPASLTPPPGALVPAILATQPSALRLAKSLGRCWGRAALLGAICATAAAVATWFLMPPAKATAPAPRGCRADPVARVSLITQASKSTLPPSPALTARSKLRCRRVRRAITSPP